MGAMRRPLRIYLGVIVVLAVAAAAAFAVVSGSAKAAAPAPTARWVAGDVHSHTWLSDGEETQAAVLEHALSQFGLDWLGTADHGAPSLYDPLGKRLRGMNPDWYLAKVSIDGWLRLKDLEWPLLEKLRPSYPDKIIVEGVEWCAPVTKGEWYAEAKTAIIEDMPISLSDFVYKFDRYSYDISRAALGVTKQNQGPAGYVTAATFLKNTYPDSAYSVISHPSRELRWPIATIRAFNNAAPAVCFGMAAIPGGQKASPRGWYSSFLDSRSRLVDGPSQADWSVTKLARTYGGADLCAAQVGGVWDALLGEGRRFWVFGDSDSHNPKGELWPGEYTQDHTWAPELTEQGIVDGLRAGKSFTAMGGLIDELDLVAASGGAEAEMGDTLSTPSGSSVTITIHFRSPATNYHGVAPVVNHVDLIAGDVTGMIAPSSPAFKTNKTNPSTHVVERFTSADWTADGKGYNVITTTVDDVTGDMYFRLRGSNLGVGVKNQTNADGDPLIDMKMGKNTPAKAWADLWFYSNPIFVDVP